jgi:DNA-binding transcriptional regulator LsrR (DeoR family)
LAGVLRARLCSVLVCDETTARAALGLLRGGG